MFGDLAGGQVFDGHTAPDEELHGPAFQTRREADANHGGRSLFGHPRLLRPRRTMNGRPTRGLTAVVKLSYISPTIGTLGTCPTTSPVLH
jgi:hypothetical protein